MFVHLLTHRVTLPTARNPLRGTVVYKYTTRDSAEANWAATTSAAGASGQNY